MDNITITLRVACPKFERFKLLTNGKSIPAPFSRRQKVSEPSGGDLHVRWVRDGKALVIEGSAPRFLHGHNIVCPLNLQEVVQEIVKRVLKHLDITPTQEEQDAIRQGRIKLDRLDIVGWIKVSHLASVGQIIASLDFGLAGSMNDRMSFFGKTIVWKVGSKYWTLMFYNKAQQMLDKYPEVWKTLSPEIKKIATSYLRVELRILRKGLRLKGWNEVRDVTEQMMEDEVEKRVEEFLADVREPLPPIPVDGHKLTKPLLVSLLKGLGVDVTSGLDSRARHRLEKMMSSDLAVLRRHHAGLPSPYARQISALKRRPVRFGVPRWLKDSNIGTAG